jgi:hypothetical protein
MARVQVGLTDSNTPVYRVAVIAAAGPVLPGAMSEKVRSCVSSSLSEAQSIVEKTLDTAIEPFSTIEDQIRRLPINQNREVSKVTVDERVKVLNSRLSLTMKGAQDQFKFKLKLCLGEYDPPAPGFGLAIALRVCDANQHQCAIGQIETGQRFEKVFEWLSRTSPSIVNRWQNVGDTGQAGPADPTLLEVYGSGELWPSEPSPEVSSVQFESFALANARSAAISYVAPALMRLSIAQGRQVLVATAAPGRALAHLRNTTQMDVVRYVTDASGAVRSAVQTVAIPSIAFKRWSDDVARTRISECARYRGTGDPKSIGDCAGYKLDQTGLDVVQNCLIGKRCLAEPTDKAFAAVASLINFDPKFAAQQALALPRFAGAATTKMSEFEQTAGRCLGKFPNDPSSASLCVVQANATPANIAMVDCLKVARGRTNPEQEMKGCLMSGISDTKVQQQTKCLLGAGNSTKEVVACTALTTLPSAVAQCFYDLQKNPTESTLAKCFPKASPDFATAVTCLQKSPNSWSNAFLCYAGNKKVIPPALQTALDCASNLSSSWLSLATCVAGKSTSALPGDAGRLVTCAAANGGFNLGAATCMAGDGLTPEQRIALQCATRSVDLSSYAICTGGMLVFKEFTQCKDHKFGDGPCFGENNEIRKFFRNVFGQDINDNTVVGQVINVPLEVVKFLVNNAPPPIQVGTVGGARVCLPWC